MILQCMEKIKGSFLLKSILTLASLDVLNKLLKGILTILLIRNLTIDEYSNFTLFTTISSFLFSFFINGLYTNYTLNESERISRTGNSSMKLFNLNLIIVSFINVVLIIGCSLLQNKNANKELYVLSMIYSFTICLLELCKSYYLVNKEFKKSGNIVNRINILMLVSLVILIIFKGINFKNIVIIHIVITGVYSLVNIYNIYIKNKCVADLDNCEINIKQYYRDALWIVLYTALLAIFNQMDVFIISHYLDKKSVAIYGVSFKYYTLLLSLLPAIKAVLKIRTTQKDMLDSLDYQKHFVSNWIKKTSLIVVPLIFLAILIIPIVFPILNGDQYNDSIIPFQIFCIGVGLSYIFSPSSNVLMSMKKYEFMTILALVICIINYIGNILLVKQFGIIGVVFITIISHALINILSTIKVLRL